MSSSSVCSFVLNQKSYCRNLAKILASSDLGLGSPARAGQARQEAVGGGHLGLGLRTRRGYWEPGYWWGLCSRAPCSEPLQCCHLSPWRTSYVIYLQRVPIENYLIINLSLSPKTPMESARSSMSSSILLAHSYFPFTKKLALRHGLGPPWSSQSHSAPQTPASGSGDLPGQRQPSCLCTALPGSPCSQAPFKLHRCQGNVSHHDRGHGCKRTAETVGPTKCSLPSSPDSGRSCCCHFCRLTLAGAVGTKLVWVPVPGCTVMSALPTPQATIYPLHQS